MEKSKRTGGILLCGNFNMLSLTFTLFQTPSKPALDKKFWLLVQELDNVEEELKKIAVVKLLQHRSIISLIGNVQRSSLILEKVTHFQLTDATMLFFSKISLNFL